MPQIRETGFVNPPKEVVVKAGKIKEVVKEIKGEVAKGIPVEPVVEIPITLESKVLDYICKHPNGVKIADMEQPLGESRMKLGFITKVLLDEGKVQKVENVYFLIK
jgi:hypothetical protein